MRKRLALTMLAVSFGLASVTPAFANPPPPTNGGNGAGKSGQCTGNPNDRPSSCHDQGGPGNQPGPP